MAPLAEQLSWHFVCLSMGGFLFTPYVFPLDMPLGLIVCSLWTMWNGVFERFQVLELFEVYVAPFCALDAGSHFIWTVHCFFAEASFCNILKNYDTQYHGIVIVTFDSLEYQGTPLFLLEKKTIILEIWYGRHYEAIFTRCTT